MADLVERQAVLKELRRRILCFDNNYTKKGYQIIKKCIEAMPKADTERHAHWGIWDGDTNTYECSNCKNPFTLLEGTPEQNTYFYCPYCGCRMDEVVGNE